MPLHATVATSLFSHLEPHRQSLIYLRNTAWLCKANSFGRVLWGGRDAPKVSPPAAACPPQPPPPKPTRDVFLVGLGLVYVYLTGLSRSAPVLRHQRNQPKGSLDVPVKEDHIPCAIKIQAKHWSKPGLSQPGNHAVPQPAAFCALAYESLLIYIFLYIYAHVCIHI